MTDAPSSDPNVIHLPTNGSGSEPAPKAEGDQKPEKKDNMDVD